MDSIVKDPVYVTGHQNPDTDSIVSAIAYAALRNALGDREYVAARLGNVSDETQRVLDKFDAEPPVLISNVRTQVRDLVFDTPPAMDRSVTIFHAWETMKQGDGAPSVIPVVEDDGSLYGMLTTGDIATHSMKNVDAPHVDNVPVYNLLSVLEGQIVNQPAGIPEELSGDVIIAVPTAHEGMLFNNPNSIVVCGQQADMVRHALDIGVKAVVICQADVSEEFRNDTSDTLIITSPLSAYRTARMINLALPVDRICAAENLKVFHLDDYLDDVKDVLLNSRYRAYPILDENDKVVGTMGRYHMIRPKRKRVVLVDHNELSQTVPGLSEAEVLGIIDHHRLADIQTTGPIFFRNEVLGSTATIISGMYQEKGIMPSKKIAGLLCSAIISDTVMFKSPTCTPHDKVIAERMARIAEVTLEEVGNTVFAGADLSKPVEELIFNRSMLYHYMYRHQKILAAEAQMRDAIYALSTTENTLFLKNRKGDLWKIAISGEISMETGDNTAAQPQTATIPLGARARARRITLRDFLSATAVTEQVFITYKNQVQWLRFLF